MKKLSDSAAEWIENLFNLFYGGRSLFGHNGYVKNERHETALVDMTSAETRAKVARIDEECRQKLSGVEAELQRLAIEVEGTEAALHRTESHIDELRDEISRVALADPHRAKELADNREMEQHRLAALARLVDETKDLIGTTRASSRTVVDAAIEAERAAWDAEITAHVDAIEALAAEMFNRSEAIRAAGSAKYDCYNRFKAMLPKPPRVTEYVQPPMQDVGPGRTEAMVMERLSS